MQSTGANRGFRQLPRVAAPAVALAGFGTALASSDVPQLVAIIVLTGVLFPLTRLIVGSLVSGEDREFLLSLLLWAIGARFLAFGLIRGLIDPVLLAPDAITYENGGWAILQYWEGNADLPERLQGTLQVGYFYTNAALYRVFGRVPEAVAVLNLFFSVWTVAVMYQIARLLVPDRPAVARISAILFAFYPSIVLWSVLNIREAPMIFFLTCTVLLFLRLQRRPSPPDVPLLILVLGAMLFYRQYMAALVGGACAVGLLVSFSRTPRRALLLGGGLLISLSLVAQSAGWTGTLTQEQASETLGTLQMLRTDMARGAGSSFIGGSDVSTVGGAITYLPLGLTYFLLAPFPWALSSLLQVITLPETVIWYALLPFGLAGGVFALRRRLLQMSIPIMVLIAVSFAYSLVQGNVGTAFRHRAQVLPLMMVMVALGLVLWAERRAARRAQRAARRAQAQAALRRPGG